MTALEWNDPAPPTLAHEMVCRPAPSGPGGRRVVRKLFPPLITVPIPPTLALDTVCRPPPPGPGARRLDRKLSPPLITVPIPHPGEARPDGIDRVLGVLAEMPAFAGKERSATGGINNPAAMHFALF